MKCCGGCLQSLELNDCPSLLMNRAIEILMQLQPNLISLALIDLPDYDAPVQSDYLSYFPRLEVLQLLQVESDHTFKADSLRYIGHNTRSITLHVSACVIASNLAFIEEARNSHQGRLVNFHLNPDIFSQGEREILDVSQLYL